MNTQEMIIAVITTYENKSLVGCIVYLYYYVWCINTLRETARHIQWDGMAEIMWTNWHTNGRLGNEGNDKDYQENFDEVVARILHPFLSLDLPHIL